MAIQITAVRLRGGAEHRHIERFWWFSPIDRAARSSILAELVDWVDRGGKAYVLDAQAQKAEVRVVTPARGGSYLQAYAAGAWTDDLLALPRR